MEDSAEGTSDQCEHRSGYHYPTTQEVLVYNIKLDEWTDSYEPPQTPTISASVETASATATAAPVTEQGQSSGEDMTSRARTAAIAGASSAVVILLICGAFLIQRRKMRKTSQSDVIDKNHPKYNRGRKKKHKNNPQYPPYPGEGMDGYALVGLELEYESAS